MRVLACTLALLGTASAQELTVAQRNDACYAMRGQRSSEAVATMREAIADPVVRACAARNLREAGAVEALIDALNTDPDTRAAASRELGALRDSRAIEPLGRAALDANVLVAASAIDALAAYEDRAVLPHLLKANALQQAARFHDPAVLPLARRVLDSSDLASKLIAISVIGELGDASDIPRLRALAARSEPVSARARGFGFMPAIDLARVAQNAMESILARR